MLKSLKNLSDMQQAFPDEDACIKHFRTLRWPDAEKITCPHCRVIGKHYTLGNNTHKCRDCRKKFTVRNGTIFEDSKIGLRKWFMAVFLMTSHKKGISSCQLAKDIGVTQKTAWFMLHRIRNAAMAKEFNTPPLKGTVEIDECYVGPNPRFQHADKRVPRKGCPRRFEFRLQSRAHSRFVCEAVGRQTPAQRRVRAFHRRENQRSSPRPLVPVHGPVHASWLNQIEIYFSILQRKALAPDDFSCLAEVEDRLLRFQECYERTATPFDWRFTRADLARLTRRFAVEPSSLPLAA